MKSVHVIDQHPAKQEVTTRASVKMVAPDPYMDHKKAFREALRIFAFVFLGYWQVVQKTSKLKSLRASTHFSKNPEDALTIWKSLKRSARWFCAFSLGPIALVIALFYVPLQILPSVVFIAAAVSLLCAIFIIYTTSYKWKGWTTVRLALAWGKWRKLVINSGIIDRTTPALSYGKIGEKITAGYPSVSDIEKFDLVRTTTRTYLTSLAEEIKKCESEGRPIKRWAANRKFNQIMEFCSLEPNILVGAKRSDFFK